VEAVGPVDDQAHAGSDALDAQYGLSTTRRGLTQNESAARSVTKRPSNSSVRPRGDNPGRCRFRDALRWRCPLSCLDRRAGRCHRRWGLGDSLSEDDPDAEDARSLDFVREFVRHVQAAGFSVRNVDAFVVLGPIRLRPHIASMRANLADVLGLDESAVSVKARSNDGLGPEGEGTACAAWANVLVYPSGPL
jgi:YgbB family